MIHRVLYNVFKNMPSLYYYAVAKGRKPGIYNTWAECKLQVNEFSGPIFKKFSTETEAQNFINKITNPDKNTKGKRFSKRGKRARSKSSNIENEPLPPKKSKTEDFKHLSAIQAKNKKPGEFTVDIDGYVNVYTDGACSSNGGKNARAGIGVWFGDEHPLNVSKAVVGRATNNMAEIQAVTVAAEQAKKAGIKKLKVNTDSKFLISCIKNWMPKWKANGWVTQQKKPVINKVELIEMEKALKSLDIAWNHVNGHVGIHGNEMADALARKGALEYTKPCA